MRAKDLLKIDFDLYRRILINGMIVYPTKISVFEAYSEDSKSNRIMMIGYKGKDEIFFTSYEEDELLEVTDNKKNGLFSMRKDVRGDETN